MTQAINTLAPVVTTTSQASTVAASAQQDKITAASMQAQLASQPAGAALKAGGDFVLVAPSDLDVSGTDDSGNSLDVGVLVTTSGAGSTILYIASPVYTIVAADGNSYSLIPKTSIIGVLS